MSYILTGISNGSKQSLGAFDATERAFYVSLLYLGVDAVAKYGVLTFEIYAPNSGQTLQWIRAEMWFRGAFILLPEFPPGYYGGEIIAYWVYSGIPYELEVFP